MGESPPLPKTPSRTLALLCLALMVGSPARPDAATRGRMMAGGVSPEGVPWLSRPLSDRFDALDFPKEAIDHFMTWEGGPQLEVPDHLEEHFTALQFDELKEHYFRPKGDEKKQPGAAYGHSLGGVTGLITLPDSYVLPHRAWSVGFNYQNYEHGASHWPNLYRALETDVAKFYVNRGFRQNYEAGLILHLQDSNITYQTQGANPIPPNFNDDLILGGVAFKAAIPMYDMLMAAGFSVEIFDDQHRNLMDLRDYENMASAFLTMSNGGRRWDGTVGIKYVKYGFGRRPPVGANTNQIGFSPPTDWTQIGIGFEYGRWAGFSLIAEATKRHTVDFIGIGEAEVNVGAQYKAGDILGRAYLMRINQDDTDHIGFSLSLRFD